MPLKGREIDYHTIDFIACLFIKCMYIRSIEIYNSVNIIQYINSLREEVTFSHLDNTGQTLDKDQHTFIIKHEKTQNKRYIP